MDDKKEITRLQGMVQWYSTQLQSVTHQLAKVNVDNAMLVEEIRQMKEAIKDAEVSAGAPAD